MAGNTTNPLTDLNWDDVRIFLALSRQHSFVAAAAELKTTHPTVARKISSLETALQTQLFLRSEKGCQLTPAGEMLLPYAEKLESTFLSLQETVSGKNNQLIGAVRICVPDGFGNFFLASRLARFQAQHPGLEIELLAVPMYYSLSKREVDILISLYKPVTGNIITRKLTKYKFGLFTTKEYLQGKEPITCINDLRQHKIIGYIEDLLFDQDLNMWEDIVPGMKTQFRSSTLITQAYAVMGGGGIGILPYFTANRIDDLVPVLPEISTEKVFWIQVNPDSRQLARVKNTMDFIVSQIEENPDIFLSLSP